jgi:hypothetical protein
MAKFFGCKPAGPTLAAVEKFENEVMIRFENQVLLGTVYLDMQDAKWAVAVAYNQSRHPGLHGRENPLEVRYSYVPGEAGTATLFRSDASLDTPLGAGPFENPDTFARYVLDHERARVSHPA